MGIETELAELVKKSRVLASLCFPSLIFFRCVSAFKCYQNCLFKGFPHAHMSSICLGVFYACQRPRHRRRFLCHFFCLSNWCIYLRAFPFFTPLQFSPLLFLFPFSIPFSCGTLPGYAFSNSIRVIN